MGYGIIDPNIALGDSGEAKYFDGFMIYTSLREAVKRCINMMGCGISHPDPVAYRRGILPHTLIKYNRQIDFFSLNQCLWIMPENLEKETSKISVLIFSCY